MKTLILINILSNNTVARLNKFISKNKKKLGKVTVLFCAETESNRHWRLREKITFKYKILPHHSLQLKGKDLFTYFINPSIIHELNKHNSDRLVITGWDIFAYQAALFWGILRQRHITLWSGSTIYEDSWRRRLTLPLVRFFVRSATDYIAYGNRSRDYLISLGANPQKIKIFLNDVNGTYFRHQARKLRPQRKILKHQFGLSTPKNFLFVGQLIERKGILDLLSAYQRFSHQHQNWGLVIVGYGQLENQIKQFIATNQLKRIVFLDHIDQYDLPPVYVASDVLVLPSTEEVWGLVANEALHCGLTVVVGDKCGCAPDLVSKITGLTFRSGSVNSLTRALEKISQI